MAKSLNQCQFIGNLGADPEVRYSTGGDAVANFSIACTESWKDKNTGETQEKTEWIRIVAWRKLGEICGEYLHKGSKVFVSGKMRTRKWTDNNGVDRYTTEVHIDNLMMLDGRPADGGQSHGGGQASSGGQSAAASAPPPMDFDDDIPF